MVSNLWRFLYELAEKRYMFCGGSFTKLMQDLNISRIFQNVMLVKATIKHPRGETTTNSKKT